MVAIEFNTGNELSFSTGLISRVVGQGGVYDVLVCNTREAGHCAGPGSVFMCRKRGNRLQKVATLWKWHVPS